MVRGWGGFGVSPLFGVPLEWRRFPTLFGFLPPPNQSNPKQGPRSQAPCTPNPKTGVPRGSPPTPPSPSPTGRIGVAAVTAGPGVTNAVTAIKNAQMAESPLLLIGGAAASLQKVRGAHGGREGIEGTKPTFFFFRFWGFRRRAGARCRTSTSSRSSGRCARRASRCAPSATSSPRSAKPLPPRSQGPPVKIWDTPTPPVPPPGKLWGDFHPPQVSLWALLLVALLLARRFWWCWCHLPETLIFFGGGPFFFFFGSLHPRPTGPVFVELPIDVLYPFHVVEKEVGGAKSARGFRGKLVQW